VFYLLRVQLIMFLLIGVFTEEIAYYRTVSAVTFLSEEAASRMFSWA
jgi:hypothetical membrane protein